MKVVISGGSSGIGFAVAKILGERGDDVFSFDVQAAPTKLKGVTNIEANVSEEKSVRAGMEKVGGGIDVLINNAGVIRRGLLFDSSVEDFDLLFRVNVKGSWLMIKEARSYLAARPVIVQMSSGHAFNPPPDPAVYTWTKQAVISMLEAIQRSYPEYRLKSTFLGPVDTAMSCVGRTAEELEEEKKIMHSAPYVAGKIVQLLDTDRTRLLFDEAVWDYSFD